MWGVGMVVGWITFVYLTLFHTFSRPYSAE